jgi:hypothetical protein
MLGPALVAASAMLFRTFSLAIANSGLHVYRYTIPADAVV